MNERLRQPPGPRLVLDTIHEYRGYHTEGGVTRIRIFDRAGDTPVVIATELPENRNTSITNMAEALAFEITAKYLPHRLEEQRPIVWIDHWPADPHSSIRSLREDRYSIAEFEDYKPHIYWQGGKRRVRFGTPAFKPIPKEELEGMVGKLPS